MNTLLAPLVVALAAVSPVFAQEPADEAAEQPGLHDAWNRILAANVRDERVDYLAIRDRHHAELAAYLSELAKVDTDELSREELEAFQINLYNATMVDAVCARFVDGWTVAGADGKYGIFGEKLVRTGGTKITLDELEKKRALPTFKDARLHAAFVCAARSCPPLLDEAYVGERIDAQLDAKMRAFVNDPTRNDLSGNPIRISKLFEWYQGDFGGSANAVLGYLGKWTDKNVRGRKIEHLEYSWVLNIAQPEGDWVVLKRALRTSNGALRKDEVVQVEATDGDEVTVRLPGGHHTVSVKKSDTRPYRAPR